MTMKYLLQEFLKCIQVIFHTFRKDLFCCIFEINCFFAIVLMTYYSTENK